METPEFVNRNDMYGQMAEPIIYERCPEILDNGISVGFVGSNKKKTKNKVEVVHGECKKVPPLYKIFCPYDFLIIIYEENCAGFTDEQMEILLWHELLHIGIDDKGNAYLKDHDVEDFDEIIRKHGLHWSV